MNQTITMDIQTRKDLYNLYSDLKNEILLLRKSLVSILSTQKIARANKWDVLDSKALEEIRNGNGYVLENKNDINKFFKDL